MDESKGKERLDEVVPIKVDVTCRKKKRENRRMSLPVVENTTDTFSLGGFTCRKSQPVQQTLKSTANHLPTGQEIAGYFSPTSQIYSDRRSTSMPEFYGLSEFRAKHDKKQMSKNKLRRTKTNNESHLSDEPVLKLPGLSSSSSRVLDRDLLQHHQDKDSAFKAESRRKTFLPRINPNTKHSLVKKSGHTDLTEIKFNPDAM